MKKTILASLLVLFFAGWKAEAQGSNDMATPPASSSDVGEQADEILRTASTPEDYQHAVNVLTNGISREPRNYDLRKTLGWVYLEKLHQPQRAYAALAVAAPAMPSDPDAHALLAQACVETKRLSRALEEYRIASRLKPDDQNLRAQVARSLARLHHYHQARKMYEEILAADPNNETAKLGQAELAAWQGHSEGPLNTLQDVLKEDPDNADALVLSGDIHRWNWDLASAAEDYQRALQAAPYDYQATEGVWEAQAQGDSTLAFSGYGFRDNTKFGRYSAGVDTSVHLSDHAYLLAGATGWRFSNPGFANLYQGDGHLGLDYHWNRWLETSLQGTMFEYEHHDPVGGAQAAIKISPFVGTELYLNGSYHDPFISSILTVENSMRQDSAGIGFDTKLVGRFSFQNSFEAAHLSDQNNWYEETPQLSFRLFDVPATFLRVNYDYLTYAQTRTNYWTPQNRNTAGPILDTSIPLGTPHVHLDLDGRMPFVFDEERFGYQASGGPVFTWRHVEFKVSYIYAKIPGGIGAFAVPWSGQGGQASLQFRF